MEKEQITRVITLLVIAVIVAVGVYLRVSRGAEPGLTDLPEGVIAKTSTFQIAQSELDSYFAGLNREQREIESKDLEGALVGFIERKLLLEKARNLPKEALPDTNGKNQAETEDALIEALKNHIAKDVRVPEEEIRKYYDEHKSEYEGQPGGSYEEMRGAIENFLRYGLVYDEFEKCTKSLVAQSDVKRDRAWVHNARASVTNPLAKARSSGKVVIADFGRGI